MEPALPPNELAMKWPKPFRRPTKPEPTATQPEEAYTYRGGASADPTSSDLQFFKDSLEDLTLKYETLRVDIAQLSAYRIHDERDKGDIWQELTSFHEAQTARESRRKSLQEHTNQKMIAVMGDLGNIRSDVDKVVAHQQVCESELSKMDIKLQSQVKNLTQTDLLFRAGNGRTKQILLNFGLAINHHSERLTDLERELRRLSAGRTDQPAETRIVPYKQRDVVLYNWPPPDIDGQSSNDDE